MKVKRMVKRLFAVGTGAAMLGATAMGALAADLSNYPNMFVADGTFNGWIVVGSGEGSNAIGKDNLAATDIAANMWTTKAGSGKTTKTLSGDAWLASTATNILEFQGDIQDIDTYISDGQLAALADSSVTNEKGTSKYEQFLYFEGNYGSSTAGLVFAENDDDKLDVYYKIPSTQQIARYFVDFTTTFDSDIVSGAMDDYEDEEIVFIGRKYTIVQSVNSTTPSLTLMGGSVTDTLEEGKSKTYVVSGKEYTVELQSVAAYSSVDKGKFLVNGELTDALADGDSDKVAGGIVIGVTDVTNQNYAGGIHSAKFFLGADKIKLTAGATGAYTGNMEVNDETTNGVKVAFTYTQTNGDFQLDDIGVNITADDDFYVGPNTKLSANPDFDEPEALFTRNWDLEFQGLSTEETTDIKLNPVSSDSKYDLTFTNADGNTATVPLIFANTTHLSFGEKEGRELVLLDASMNVNTIRRHQYFILASKNTSVTNNDGVSHVLQYSGSDDCDTDTDPKVRFKDLSTGENIDRSFSTSGTFDLKISGTTFNFVNTSLCVDNVAINITSATNALATIGETLGQYRLNGPAGVASTGTDNWVGAGHLGNIIRTKNNGIIVIEDYSAQNVTGDGSHLLVSVITDDDDRKDDLSGTDEQVLFNFTHDATNGEVNGAIAGNTSRRPAFWVADPANSDVTKGYTRYGLWTKVTSPTSASRTVEMSLPANQLSGLLYITSGATEAATTTAGGELSRVDVGLATKLADEVTDAKAQNLIVIGGPCVNSVASELLGAPSPCTDGFTPGKARVKLVEHANGNVAMVVAGYSGDDTRLAGKVVAKKWQDPMFKGAEVEIEGTSLNDAKISAPTAVAAAPAVKAEEAAPAAAAPAANTTAK